MTTIGEIIPQSVRASLLMAFVSQSCEAPVTRVVCQNQTLEHVKAKRKHHVTRTGEYRVVVTNAELVAYGDVWPDKALIYWERCGQVAVFTDRAASLRFRRALARLAK